MTDLVQRDTQPAALVNPRRWPDLVTVPPASVRSRIARILFERVTAKLALRVEFPHGRVLGGRGDSVPVMRIHRPRVFYRRLGASGLIGFGEAYLAGDWSASSVPAVMKVFAEKAAVLVPRPLQRLRALAVKRRPSTENGTEDNNRTNISRHYDLSNEMFACFLDETMSYSAALFETSGGRPLARADLLAEAQRRKIDRLLDGAGVGPGSEILEIGTGWGELAIRAAARGARVRSITLSKEQRELAMERVAAAGFTDSVTIDLRDYREVEGEYDAVLSVEMIEAVGFDYWPKYFEVVDSVLRPGGKAGIQAITMPHDRMLATRNTYTWMHKYIFPGGMLPSVKAVEDTVSAGTAMRVTNSFAFGQHYAETLRLWRERFDTRTEALAGLGFDAVFQTMWHFYFGYCEAGFSAGYLDVHQFFLAKDSAAESASDDRKGANTR